MSEKREHSDIDYYWEKAEFQDPVEHRRHVDSYKRGIRDSYAFDKQYREEALNELYEEYKRCWCAVRGYGLWGIDESVGINGECYACFDEWYNNEYREAGGRL